MVAVSVLVSLPADDLLRRSAEASASVFLGAAAGEVGVDPREAGRLPEGVVLDTAFPAVPMGSGEAGRESFRMTARGEDARYVVRGLADAATIEALAEGHADPDRPRVFADVPVGTMPICPGAPAFGSAADVRGLLNVGGLSRMGLTGEGVAVAIVDTGINHAHLIARGLASRLDPHVFWSPTPNVKAGQYPVDHGTMCAYAASIAAPACTLLDFPILRSTTLGGSVMDGLLSDAVQAFGLLLALMLKPEEARPYHSLVVNNSWGMFHPSWDFPPGHPGRYADNPDHPFNLVVGSLAAAGADVLFAAGNCGTDCPDRRCQGLTSNVITGANSHPAVLSVAGVDVSRARVGYSSVGPGALDPEKPDLAAFTHFHGSEAFGIGSADGGTSTACPVAAGAIAAVRTRTPPSLVDAAAMRQAARATAAKPGGPPGWDAGLGHGIIAPVALAGAVLPSV